MEEDVKKQKDSKEWEDAQEKKKWEDEERVRKNREKREKKKAKKGKGSSKTNGQVNGKVNSMKKADDASGRDDEGIDKEVNGTMQAPKIAIEEVGVTIHDDD